LHILTLKHYHISVGQARQVGVKTIFYKTNGFLFSGEWGSGTTTPYFISFKLLVCYIYILHPCTNHSQMFKL